MLVTGVRLRSGSSPLVVLVLLSGVFFAVPWMFVVFTVYGLGGGMVRFSRESFFGSVIRLGLRVQFCFRDLIGF